MKQSYFRSVIAKCSCFFILINILTGLDESVLANEFLAKNAESYSESQFEQEAYQTGEAIYQKGIIQSVKVVLNDGEAPASLFACKNCHGESASGRNEGGISAPDIRWHRLIRDSRVSINRDTVQGKKRTPYNRELFSRLLKQAVTSNERTISHIMPRYLLSQKELDSLIVYLKNIDRLDESGVDDNTINVGLLLPEIDSRRKQVALQTVQAYFSEVNRLGGIFRRRLVGVVIDNEDPDGNVSVNRKQCCFAYLNLNVDAQRFERQTYAMDGQIVFSLFSSQLSPTKEQQKFEPQNIEYALYASRFEQARQINLLVNNHSASSTLKSSERQRVVRVINADEINAVLDKNQYSNVDYNWPVLFVIGKVSAENKLILEEYKAPVYSILLPTPDLISNDGVKAYRRLVQHQSLPREQLTIQFWTLSLVRSLENILQQTGAVLSREKVIEYLNRQYQYSSDFGPEISFVAGQRIGAPGGIIVQQKTADNKALMPRQWINFENLPEKILDGINE